MGDGPAKLFRADLLVGHRLDNIGAGDKHIRGVFDHENKIGHGRRIHRAARAWPHDHGNLGDNARGHDISLKDIGIPGQGINAFLDTGTARVIEADNRSADLHGMIHYLADLTGMGR